MQIPQIRIQQGYTKIGMDVAPGKLSIEQPKAELNMHQQPGDMQIRTTSGEMQIDQSKAWSALGYGPSLEMMDRIAESSHAIASQRIAEIAQAGDRMMQIQNKGNVFADLAREAVFKQYPMELRGPASFNNVQFQYMPGTMDISYTPKGVSFDPVLNEPEIEYTARQLNIYVAQKNYIHFSTAIGSNLDGSV
ncbi:hypothetical protein DCC85_20100 [Paenibacillus sp. CAA11]|uniref:DUF6470 family protein n=1 Tax=Paenibacillus sp. CAA11 TaxID=1532905 RepID=UPI000D34A686|nr:DUF6470 family protein [Paenibacillus sp. CAA11]AWB46235.1 hypothetical protein DCC85_20100 [Paenibacillus sp. CAA11]